MSATPSHAHGAAASAPRGATSHPSTESARLPALFGPRGELGALPPATRPPNVCAMPSPPRGCPRRRVRPTPRRPTPTRCGKRTGWAALGFADWHAAPDSQPHWRPGWAALGFADSHAALDSQIPVANRRGALANPPTQEKKTPSLAGESVGGLQVAYAHRRRRAFLGHAHVPPQ